VGVYLNKKRAAVLSDSGFQKTRMAATLLKRFHSEFDFLAVGDEIESGCFCEQLDDLADSMKKS